MPLLVLRRGIAAFGATAACLCAAGLDTLPPPQGLETFPPHRCFLDEGRNALSLVGVGVRDRNGIPFYALALYVNLKELRAAAGPGRKTGEELARILMRGQVSQAFISRFHQPVGRERRMQFLLENLRRFWDGPDYREDSPAMRHFLTFFDAPLDRGAETEVWVRGGAIFTRWPGRKAERTSDRGICRAFVSSYLSPLPKPGSEAPMRDALLRDLVGLMEREATGLR